MTKFLLLFILLLGASMPAYATELNKDRTALVFIEFQDEWIGPDPRLRELLVEDQQQFDDAIENARRILDTARKNNWLIAHAGLDLRDDPNYLIFGGSDNAGAGLRYAIPRAGTWTEAGAEFVEPFVPEAGEYVVKGRSGASVFKNSTLDPFLRNNGIDHVILLGFATHVCVESSLREAHDIGYNVIVVPDASGSFTAEQTEYFLNHVVHHFGHSLETEQVLAKLREAN